MTINIPITVDGKMIGRVTCHSTGIIEVRGAINNAVLDSIREQIDYSGSASLAVIMNVMPGIDIGECKFDKERTVSINAHRTWTDRCENHHSSGRHIGSEGDRCEFAVDFKGCHCCPEGYMKMGILL
jgi:hypothetical protein